MLPSLLLLSSNTKMSLHIVLAITARPLTETICYLGAFLHPLQVQVPSTKAHPITETSSDTFQDITNIPTTKIISELPLCTLGAHS